MILKEPTIITKHLVPACYNAVFARDRAKHTNRESAQSNRNHDTFVLASATALGNDIARVRCNVSRGRRCSREGGAGHHHSRLSEDRVTHHSNPNEDDVVRGGTVQSRTILLETKTPPISAMTAPFEGDTSVKSQRGRRCSRVHR